MEIWMHVYIDGNGEIILPRQNLGPHYNKQKYGREHVEKGKQFYASKKDVLSFLRAHYKGKIIVDRDNVLVWAFDDKFLPEGVKHCAFSIFTKFELKMGEKGLEINSPCSVPIR